MDRKTLTYRVFEWVFWNFLGARILMLIQPISLYTLLSAPLSSSWGVFWAQQPMWFFYVQVTQGLLTLYAHLTRRLILKAATLALTFPALPWLSWVTEINLYGDITLTTEYKVFNQIFLILPYILVQIGYAYFILRTWVRARLAQKAELPVPATNNNFGA